MQIPKWALDYRQFQLLILGIYSGLPLGILYNTLLAWLSNENIDIAIITTFAISRIFYSLKIFWAPFVDHLKIPLLYKIGQRKSWMVLFGTIIVLCLTAMSTIDTNHNLKQLYFIVIILGLASATFDIAFDAFRIELLDKDSQSLGIANTMTGYRIGLIITSAGSLYSATFYGWPNTLMFLAAFYMIGVIYIFSIKEKKLNREKIDILSTESWKIMVIDPFIDFFKRDSAFIILIAVILFKLGDAMLGIIAYKFYFQLGFTKIEIANITKIFGLIATIFGGYVGGYLMHRTKGGFHGLFIAGIIQAVSNASFIYLHHMGHDTIALTITIAIENTASGISNVALIGYISALCNRNFSATQYALLSSASGLASHSIVIFSGSLVNMLGWDLYFVMTILLALPGLMILYYLKRKTLT